MQLNQNITQAQLLQVLNQAQFTAQIGKEITAADLSGDHIKDVINKTPAELTDADLAVIRAQLDGLWSNANYARFHNHQQSERHAVYGKCDEWWHG